MSLQPRADNKQPYVLGVDPEQKRLKMLDYALRHAKHTGDYSMYNKLRMEQFGMGNMARPRGLRHNG